jgi:DNA polymerase III sliding clamp (beta) subunit (PCNA family)
MKLTVDRKALADALKTATLLPATGALPILNGVRLDAVGAKGDGTGKVTITATNLDLTIATDIEADVVDGGAVVLPRLFGALINKASAETVTLVVEGETATIEAGGVATLRTLRLEEWPKVETAEGDRFELTGPDVDNVARVLHAVSTDVKTHGPKLTGVHFVGNTAKATDSYRLAIAQLGCEDLPGRIVPGDVLTRVCRDAAAGFTMTFDHKSVTFDSTDGGTTWTSRLIEADYPPTERLIRASSPHELIVGREDLIERLRWVRLLLEGRSRAVHLVPEDGRLHIRAAADVGETEDSVLCAGDFTERWEVDAGYLLDALGELDDDEVRFELEAWNKPMQMRSTDWRLVLLVMPITKSGAKTK